MVNIKNEITKLNKYNVSIISETDNSILVKLPFHNVAVPKSFRSLEELKIVNTLLPILYFIYK